MPASPPDHVVSKNCVRCSADFTITPDERERLTRRFGTYREPNLCPPCRKKKRKFNAIGDSLAMLHAYAFGYCNTDDKVECFEWLAKQVVLEASEAGLLDGKELFKPVGMTEMDARLATHIAEGRIKMVRKWEHNALQERHGTVELSDIEAKLRTHIDAIDGILNEYFNRAD